MDRLGPATPVSQAAGSWPSAGGGAECPAERRWLRPRVVSLLPAPPPPPWLRREGGTCGRVAIDAQPVALPRGCPDGRRIRRWRRCGAGSSAAAHPTAVVGASSLVAVDVGLAGGRGRPSGARHPSVAGGGLLTARWRLRRKSCRAQAAPPPAPKMRGRRRCAARFTRAALLQEGCRRRSYPKGSRCRSASCVIADKPVVRCHLRSQEGDLRQVLNKIACARYVGEADSSILRSQRGSPRGRAPAVQVGPPSPRDCSTERLQQGCCHARDARFQRAPQAAISARGCSVTANSLASVIPHLA